MTPQQEKDLRELLTRAEAAADGDSTDDELEALNDALDYALSILGMERP